ncbi:hypothetical protein JB92DRAFT_2877475 [Gautieria morchelliformis]|nr:hypothetical protein JB92DRAFT_2877475 [Gautieria morchelliformis]
MQETPLLSLEYDLVPGHSLGPFVLGSSLWKTLEYLRESKGSYPQVNVKFDPENPVTSPVILHVVPYLDLLFSGAYQRLHTISVRRLQPTGLGMPFTLRYKNSILASSDEPLRKSGVTRVFGPTYPGDVMRYPGVWFGFQEDGEDLNKGSKVGQGDDRTCEVRKVVIRQKALEDEARDVLDEVCECSAMSGELSSAIVKVHDGITLHFHPSTSPVVRIRLGTSAEDLNCDLGPPLRVHYKEDDRMNIHASSGLTEEGAETDYFYNYFHLGMDFLISGSAHKVKKIILHTNVPGSPAFQRYMRCPWEIQGNPEDDDDDSPPRAKFYDKIDVISQLLNPVSLATTPSMELDRVDDERLCLPGSKTQLLGFDGAVAEVSVANVLTLMLF